MSWQPQDTEFEHKDTDVNINYLIYYQVEGSYDVTSYQWTVTPIDSNPFSITSTAQGISVVASTLSGLFKPEYIDYWEEEGLRRVDSWESLPPEKEIVEFKPSSVSSKTYQLSVTANILKSSEGNEYTETVSSVLTFVIWHDYDEGKQKLEEYMS